jgi:hypothetical protein
LAAGVSKLEKTMNNHEIGAWLAGASAAWVAMFLLWQLAK